MTITVLLVALAALGIAFTIVLLGTAAKRGETRPNAEAIGLGAVTNFFDTLGIGSFATTTAWIKFRHMVPDSFIPATLNAGHALPTVVQSAIYLVILGVRVDPVLLASCIAAAVLGIADRRAAWWCALRCSSCRASWASRSSSRRPCTR